MTTALRTAALLTLGLVAFHAVAQRSRDLVANDDIRIEVIAEGAGPLVVLLPSRGRDSEDFDAIAEGIAKAGYRVLRPQPRGAGRSSGPMHGLTLHDFARDVANVRAVRHAVRVATGVELRPTLKSMDSLSNPKVPE